MAYSRLTVNAGATVICHYSHIEELRLGELNELPKFTEQRVKLRPPDSYVAGPPATVYRILGTAGGQRKRGLEWAPASLRKLLRDPVTCTFLCFTPAVTGTALRCRGEMQPASGTGFKQEELLRIPAPPLASCVTSAAFLPSLGPSFQLYKMGLIISTSKVELMNR